MQQGLHRLCIPMHAVAAQSGQFALLKAHLDKIILQLSYPLLQRDALWTYGLLWCDSLSAKSRRLIACSHLSCSQLIAVDN